MIKISLVCLVYVIIVSCSENYEKKFYSDGSLKAKYQTNKDGKIDGLFKSFHENGNVFIEANYKEGVYHGNVKTYHENGYLKREGSYSHGKKNSIHKEYYDNGSIHFKASYSNDYIDGELIEYDKERRVIAYEFYKEGILYSEYYFIDSLKSEYLNSLDKLIVSPRFDTLHIQDSIKVTIDIVQNSNMTYNYEVRTICEDITAAELNTYEVEEKNSQIEYWFKPTEPGDCHFNVLALPAGRNGWDYHLLGIGEYYAIENKDDLPQ